MTQQINNQTVIVSNGRRGCGFPLLAFMGFCVALFWPAAVIPGWIRWPAEGIWLLLLAFSWGVAHGLSRATPPPPPPPARHTPTGPRDYTLL